MDEPSEPMSEPTGEPVLTDSLRELCAELRRVQAQAQELGLFVGDRTTLECPCCRLVEDITIEGFLIVYSAERLDRALEKEWSPRVTRAWDTGLRFADLSDEQRLCPVCGAVFTASEEETPAWWEESTEGNP